MLKTDEVFVYGLNRETAQALLSAARTCGLDPRTVRAVELGFIVPEPVYDAATVLHPPTLIDGLAPDAVF